MPLQARRRGRAQAPFLLVLAILVAAVGYLTLEPQHWRRGVGVISVAMMLAGLLRIALPRAQAGLLVVRGRWWDAVCYLFLGLAILLADIRVPY